MLKSIPFLILLSMEISLSSQYSIGYQEGYRIGKNDILRIEVAGDSDFSKDAAVVSENGTISFPVLGELKVEGLALAEIAGSIRSALIDKKLLTQPVVSVSVREYRSQSITILGEVKTTGRFYLRGVERLFDKIVEAGGLTPIAGDIVVTSVSADGARNITIKSKDLISDATVLRAGDVVVVQAREASQVFVSGEVVSGRAINFVEGMTLSQAVVIAGGLNRFGSKSKVSLKRVTGGKETLMQANLSDIEKGKAKDIPLRPNDTIIVGRRIF